MANVIVDKNKIDLLANAISAKSGEPLTLTLDEMVEAVDGIESGITPTGTITITTNGSTDVTNYAIADVQVPSSAPTLQSKTLNVSSAGTTTVTADSGYDGLDEVKVNVPSGAQGAVSATRNKQNGYLLTRIDFPNVTAGFINTINPVSSSQILQNETVTPSASVQTVTPTTNSYYLESVTVNPIPSGSVSAPASITATGASSMVDTINGTLTLTKNNVTNTPTISEGYVSSATGTTSNVQLTGALAMGTVNAPTATKGSVSNHSVSVTPSVTYTNGWITGNTQTGTAVTVSASELVSGSQTITQNGTVDVTNLAEVVVSVEGGGGSGVQVDSKQAAAVSSGTLVFTGLKGEPTSFYVYYKGSSAVSPASTQSIVTVTHDGSTPFSSGYVNNLKCQSITNTSNAQVTYFNSDCYASYSGGTLEIIVTRASTAFINDATAYGIAYTYGGSQSDVNTATVQVGSGATSISFTGITNEPTYWSLIFQSNFSTSSGYQRVISVCELGGDAFGLAMDSGAHFSDAYWSYTYNNGTLTVSSQGTNAGGYFHQPGNYQLTYVTGGASPYQSKSVTYTPTTSTQTQTIEADTGYDALSKVNVTVNPMPTMALPSSASATSSGTSKATITPTSSAQYLNIPTGYNATAQYYTIGASGGGSFSVATTTWDNSTNTTTSHQFTGLSGTPKFAVLRCTSQLTRSSSNTYYYIADIVWNGTDAYGNYHLRSNGSLNNVASNATTKFTVTTGTNSITFTSGGSRGGAPGSFYNGTYELTYIY